MFRKLVLMKTYLEDRIIKVDSFRWTRLQKFSDAPLKPIKQKTPEKVLNYNKR